MIITFDWLKDHLKTNLKEKKIEFKTKQTLKVKIKKEKGQGCSAFGSCLIKNVKNTESPQWLKDKLISVGQKPISAIVDICLLYTSPSPRDS